MAKEKQKAEVFTFDETMWCHSCKYKGKECEMKLFDEREFDFDLSEYFPNDPHRIEEYLQYKEPKIKALPIPEFKEKILPVVSNTYRYAEDVVLYPFIGYNFKSRSYKDIHTLYKPDTKVGLLMSGKDDFLIDSINLENWAEKIKVRKFDFVLSPNISFYFNQPSCSTVLNRLVSNKAIKDLIEAGIPVIPSANYLWDSDIKRYSKWLEKCGFEKVYYNMQLLKYDSMFEKSVDFLKRLRAFYKGEILILGVFNPSRIKQLEEIGEFRYVSSQLNMLSIQRVGWKDGKEEKKNQFEALFYDDTMNENLVNYRKFIKKTLEK